MEKPTQTTMKVSRKFLDFLDKKMIHKSESYEDIIKRLIRSKNLDKDVKEITKPSYGDAL